VLTSIYFPLSGENIMRHNSRRLIVPILLLTGLVTSAALAINKAPVGKGNGKIAFVSNREHVERIYTMNPDGSGLTKLTDGPHQLQPAWSPDGTKIAYMDRLKDATALYLMNADGSDSKLLVSNIFHDVNLAWSPDGTKIAFCSVKSSRGSEFSLHVINIDGSNELRLAEGAGSPAWSPDGKQIAFTTFRGIDLINADGTDRRQLARLNTWVLHSLAWSPDGREIVFGSSRSSSDQYGNTKTRFTIESISAEGSDVNNARLLGYGRNPSWSPDGSRIVFERRGTYGPASTQIWVMNRDGKNQTQLTEDGANWSPSWQPVL
jgi:Tol biopolymer transport system component